MKPLFLTLLLFTAICSFAQFTDTTQLNAFIRDTITDRRPNKITAAQLQKGLLGILHFMPLNTPLNNSQVGYGSSNNALTGNSTFTFNDTTNTLQVQSLQVNGGASFGSAAITSGGSLINTNAILSRHFIPRFHGYHDASPYISKLDDVIYNFSSRLNTTSTLNDDNSYMIDILFPPDEVAPSGITYSQGSMFFAFWPNGMPGAISVMGRNALDSNWYGPYTADVNNNLNPGGGGLFEVPIGMGNWLIELKITIAPLPGGFVNLQDMAYVLNTDNEGLYNPYPYVSKYSDEHIYNYFYLKNGGVDNIRLSPYLYIPNYFLNNVLIGSSAPNGTASLQVTGDVTASGNLGLGTIAPTAQLHTTGSVRLAGLTPDNTQNRILVSDADGDLFYRDASSLALNGGAAGQLAYWSTDNNLYHVPIVYDSTGGIGSGQFTFNKPISIASGLRQSLTFNVGEGDATGILMFGFTAGTPYTMFNTNISAAGGLAANIANTSTSSNAVSKLFIQTGGSQNAFTRYSQGAFSPSENFDEGSTVISGSARWFLDYSANSMATHLLNIDSLGRIYVLQTPQTGSESDGVLVLSSDGEIKTISQSGLGGSSGSGLADPGSNGILKRTASNTTAIASAGDFPTLNQNTTGTAANLSGTPALPNGTAATTQTTGDNSTKLATTAFVQNQLTTLGTIAAGSYTPTVTDIGSSTTSRSGGICRYMRIDNLCTVTGYVRCTPSAVNTGVAVYVSLPISSTISLTGDVQGVANCQNNTGSPQFEPGNVSVGASNNIELRALTTGGPTAGDVIIQFVFTYIIQ